MDTLTHAMAGLLVGSVAATRKVKLAPVLVTGVLAGAMLDADAVLYLINIALYFQYHRLFTHSLLFAPGYAALAALPAWVWVRRSYLYFYLIALIAILVHLALDLPCAYHLYLLYPLSRKNFSLEYIPYTSRAVLMTVTVLSLVILYLRQNQLKNPSKEN